MKLRRPINFLRSVFFVFCFWLGAHTCAYAATTPLSDVERKLKAIEDRLAAIEDKQEIILTKEDKILEEIQVLKVRVRRT